MFNIDINESELYNKYQIDKDSLLGSDAIPVIYSALPLKKISNKLLHIIFKDKA